MERLTIKEFESLECEPYVLGGVEYYGYSYGGEVINKLAEYEDLEEQGLMLRLPCKVGDTVYFVDFDENEYDEAIVESIEFGRNGFLINSDCEVGRCLGAEYLFLTQEAVEQALADMKRGVSDGKC